MAQENLPLEGRLVRGLGLQHAASRALLCWSFAFLEGVMAMMLTLVPAVTYHVVIMHVPVAAAPIQLYLAYSAAVGLVYGGFAAVSAGQFLDRSQHPHTMLAQSAMSWTGAFGITMLSAFLLGMAGELSRVTLTSAFLLGLPALVALRGLAYSAVEHRIREGRLQYQKVVVIGQRSDVLRFLVNGNLWKDGYQLSGALYLEDVADETGGTPVQAVVSFAERYIAQGAEFVVFVGELGDINGLEKIVAGLKRFAVSVVCAPATSNVTFKFLDVVPIGANNSLRFLRKPMSDGSVLLKRLFDIVSAGLGLVLLAPLFLVVALLIKLDSPGPVFYRQERRGFNGESFFIWKFRSMRVTEDGRAMTQVRAGDSRISRVGRFIRAKSIDELPQLLNVLHGEMSLVGPRPHAIKHDDELGGQLASYAHRQRIKPGITGWAQVNGFRGETTTIEQIEGRTTHDLHYIDNWSIFLDCWIVLLTVFSPKTRQNAV